MEWYYIVLIVLGSLLLLGALVFLSIYFISLSKRRKIRQEANEYYTIILQAVGGIDNIIDINVQSSRLSFVLKEPSLLNKNSLEGVGIIQSNKKVTLVIGEYAKQYYDSIKKQLESK